ncbi:hypothetical protein RSAG8_12506, partial [Rhizoctonia solani AG-8 WAC10335]
MRLTIVKLQRNLLLPHSAHIRRTVQKRLEFPVVCRLFSVGYDFGTKRCLTCSTFSSPIGFYPNLFMSLFLSLVHSCVFSDLYCIDENINS